MLIRRCCRAGFRRYAAGFLAALSAAGLAWAGDPAVPPPRASGRVWSLAVLPDSQAYNQCYDFGGTWKGRGFQYRDRWPKQIEWVVRNREFYNIRFAASVGDHVQNFGFDPSKAEADAESVEAKKRQEWLNAVAGVNLFHEGGDPERPALVPYALAIGNHDYSSPARNTLECREYIRYLGPGRFRGSDSKVKPSVAPWYGGDDMGWEYRRDGQVMARGVGRNSWQTFSGGGKEFLHLTLECAATDAAIAWAKEVLGANPGKLAIVTMHSFIDGDGKLLLGERMGRAAPQGPNPTNDAPAILEKLVSGEDRIFLILCGHMYFKKHVVVKNARGHDVLIVQACFHLNAAGGRIDPAELPATSPWKGEADKDRNGSGWLVLLVFDPDGRKIRSFTYSPVIDTWATDRPRGDKSTTYPLGEDVVEEFDFDLDARFGR